jgi:hypothetical protein
MKKLSETYEELGIAFSFPIEIKDGNGNQTYWELSYGYWSRREYDSKGNETYYVDSNNFRRGTPRSSKTCSGKVIDVDGIKYKLEAL